MTYRPEGFHSVTPYLTIERAASLIEFLGQAFGAVETSRTSGPEGVIRHAEIRIGDSMIEVSEANSQWGSRPGALHLYVEDCDATYQRALAAGATSLYGPNDAFYGDRNAAVTDPSGNYWYLATRVEHLTEEEVQRRMAAISAGPSSAG